MKRIKKILLMFLFVFSLTVFAACGEKEPEVKINIAENSIILSIGEIHYVEYTVDKEVEIEWSSSNPDIVSVEDGKIEALKAGDVTITANVEGSKASDSLNVSVKHIAIVEENIELAIGSEKELTVVLENAEKVVWTSGNPEIATVENGKVKAVSPGEVFITATIEGTNISYKVKVNVLDVVVLDFNHNLVLNELVDVKVLNTIKNEEITEFEVTSDASDFVFVDGKRLFGLKIGSANITVKYKLDGKDYQITEEVTVSEVTLPVTNIVISGNKGVLIGNKSALKVNTKQEVLYKSANQNIATVDEKGEVTGVSQGSTVITAYLASDESVTGKFELMVFEKPEVTKLAGGEYYYDEVLDYNELPFGVTQYTHWGYTKTDNAGIDEDGIGASKLIIDVNKYYSQQVNVLELPSQLETKVVVWANTHNNAWTLNSVRAMIQDYEKENPEYKVIAAVNGDFFDINGLKNFRYSTSGATIGDGEYFKSSSGPTIGFTNDGTVNSLIAGVPEITSYLVLNVYDENGNEINEFKVQNVNKEPGNGEASVYFGVYNGNHEYESKAFSTTKNAFVVTNAERTLPHSEQDFYGKGIIDSVEKSMTLDIGQFAIVTDNADITNALGIGKEIRIQYEYAGKFAGVASATGCGDTVLEGGELHSDAIASGNLATRAPRTSIGVREDGTIVMCVIDGRQAKDSMYGLDRNELGSIMSAYGCVNAYNLDGGGSSTMVIRTGDGFKVLNSPSDGSERRDANCVLIVAKDPGFETNADNITVNSAVINARCINEDYKDFPMYVKLNGEFLEVIDGKVEVNGLNNNTKYDYCIYYKNEKGEMIQTLTMNSFTTSKTGFKLLSVVVVEDKMFYTVKVNYIDPDKASDNVEFASVSLNGIATFLMYGEKAFPKTLFKDNPEITSVSISFTYEENGEIIEYKNDDSIFYIIKCD